MAESKSWFFLLDTTPSYRYEKEAFVSGHHGCSMGEVVLSLAPITTGLLLNRVALSFLSLAGKPGSSIPLPTRFMFECCTIVLPSLFSFTLLADYSPHVAISQLALVALLHLAAKIKYNKPLLGLSLRPDHALHILAAETRKSFVSNFRSCMMVATWIAILAVDFQVFPRRFAKTETFGTSVMDMGVGAFIFSSAIVSKQTRRLKEDENEEPRREPVLQPASKPISNGVAGNGREGRRRRASVTSTGSGGNSSRSTSRSASKRRTTKPAPAPVVQKVVKVVQPRRARRSAWSEMGASVVSTLVSVSPLMVLGFGRLIVHTALNYQTHVTEYGVHWNFAFTSMAVALLAASLEISWRLVSIFCEHYGFRDYQVSRNWTAAFYGTLGFVIAIGYQHFLRSPTRTPFTIDIAFNETEGVNATSNTVQDYILYADREQGFVAQNREGLASVCGFFPVYLCGVALGRVVLDANRDSARLWRTFALKLALVCGLLWGVVDAAVRGYGDVSRRLVNFPYFVWIVAFSFSFLLSLLVIDVITIVPGVDNIFAAQAQPKKHDGSSKSIVLPKVWSPASVWKLVKSTFIRPEPFSPATLAAGSVIMEATNINFLALFITSNLLVGLVNHTMRTIEFNDTSATAILSVYMLANCGIAVLLKRFGVQLKFW